MQIASIVPTQFLELTRGESFYMALAHLVDGDEKYADFFKEMSRKGAHILMDNGAAEHAQLPDLKSLLKRAGRIGATELVLPDELMNREVTLEKTQRALNQLKAMELMGKYKLMAVPQGADLGEWEYCLINLMHMPGINSFGISKFLTLNLGDKARFAAMDIYEEVCKEQGKQVTDYEIHLLGCAYDPAEVRELAERYPYIRSCDSAIPYVYAQKGLEMLSEIERPQFEIDFHGEHELEQELLEYNIGMWKGLENVGK